MYLVVRMLLEAAVDFFCFLACGVFGLLGGFWVVPGFEKNSARHPGVDGAVGGGRGLPEGAALFRWMSGLPRDFWVVPGGDDEHGGPP